ncbi:helix-turn-helix domain-containing protein [Pseudomonas reactans]|uniref:helix-turn-helix domain-containing protein n=1 Tax=Pseudomonas reactans TaxID=117680 RepID=UPI00159F9B01|nr:helix-turn-helix transcriptional regulator [Pseudomonas reactans]NWA68015.1 helix-turn-helix transcriptional regulator [Pseudomonas reactans]
MSHDFANNLIHLRGQNNLTQQELGALAGVSPSQISRYEAGLAMPRKTVLRKLADALGVTVDEFQGATAKRPLRIYEGFSSRLVDLRSSCGMTRKQLSEHSGISTEVITQLELGQVLPLEEDVIALSQALGSSAYALAGHADEQEVVVLRLTEAEEGGTGKEFAKVPLPPTLFKAFENSAKERGLSAGTYLSALVRLDLARHKRPQENVTLEQIIEEMKLEST